MVIFIFLGGPKAHGHSGQALRRAARVVERDTQVRLCVGRGTRRTAIDKPRSVLPSSPTNLTGNARTVLLKNSTTSRPQGRNADNTSNWITSEWPTT